MDKQGEKSEILAAKLAAIDALAANFSVEMPLELKKMWLTLLASYSAEMVAAACTLLLKQYTFKTLPPFAVLQEALDELSGTGEESLTLQAQAEWGVLFEAISNNGFYNEPKHHPTTQYVLKIMGGWSAACHWESREIDFKRKDFIRLWMDSHGRVEYMRLGADAVQAALMHGQGRGPRPLPVGSIMAALAEGKKAVRQ